MKRLNPTQWFFLISLFILSIGVYARSPQSFFSLESFYGPSEEILIEADQPEKWGVYTKYEAKELRLRFLDEKKTTFLEASGDCSDKARNITNCHQLSKFYFSELDYDASRELFFVTVHRSQLPNEFLRGENGLGFWPTDPTNGGWVHIPVARKKRFLLLFKRTRLYPWAEFIVRSNSTRRENRGYLRIDLKELPFDEVEFLGNP